MSSGIINEEISAVKFVTLVLIKILLERGSRKTRRVLLFITRQLEGIAVVKDHNLVIASDLLVYCRILANEAESDKQFPKQCPNASSIDNLQLDLLDEIWKIESIDDMHSIVKQIQLMIASPTTITRSSDNLVSSRSLIGRFAQKLAISMKLLQFDESWHLFNGISCFRQSSRKFYYDLLEKVPARGSKISIYGPSNEGHVKVSGDASSHVKETHPATDQLVYEALNRQLKQNLSIDSHAEDFPPNTHVVTNADLEELVDTQIELLEKFGTDTPQELKAILEQMVKSSSQSGYSAHNKKGFPASSHFLWYLERLHSGDYHGAFDALHQYFDYMVSQGSKFFYHFALISKASLHQHFGEDEKALNSIEEAISVARENKDNKSLTYVLSWLFDFMRRKPSLWETQSLQQIRNEERLLDFLVKKSSSISLSLASTSYRFETEYLMTTTGIKIKYFDSLLKATFSSLNDSPITFIGTCHTAFRLWNRVGCHHLSMFYCDLGLCLSEEYGSIRDAVDFRFRKSELAHAYGYSGAAQEDITKCQSYDAKHVFERKPIQTEMLLSTVAHALKKGRINVASELLKTLPESDMVDQELFLTRIELTTSVLIASSNFSEALNLVGSHLDQVASPISVFGSNTFHEIKLNLFKSRVLITAGASLRAYSLLVKQIQTAKDLGLRSLVVEGLQLLMMLLNNTGQAEDAQGVGVSALALTLTTGGDCVVSKICYELARSCSILMTQHGKGNPETFNRFLKYLSWSITGFKRIADLEMLSQCFLLEKQIASANYFQEETETLGAMSEFAVHSSKGIDILQRRVTEERSYGYL